MSPKRFRARIFAAPEMVAVDIADATLASLILALRAEHPELDHGHHDDLAPVRRRARALLGPVRRLRRALAGYRRAVDHLVDDLHRDDLPIRSSAPSIFSIHIPSTSRIVATLTCFCGRAATSRPTRSRGPSIDRSAW
jgi:hypothetical protein